MTWKIHYVKNSFLSLTQRTDLYSLCKVIENHMNFFPLLSPNFFLRSLKMFPTNFIEKH